VRNNHDCTRDSRVSGNFSVEVILPWGTILEVVRNYTINMVHGLSVFKCVLCRYSITTRAFSTQNGSCRTQAARVMNNHATTVHGSPKTHVIP